MIIATILTFSVACIGVVKEAQPGGILISIGLNVVTICVGLLSSPREDRGPVAVPILQLLLAVVYLHGCVVPTIEIYQGPPVLDNRGVSSAEGAVRAALVSSMFSAAILGGWMLIRPAKTSAEEAASSLAMPSRGAGMLLVALGVVGLTIRMPGLIAGDLSLLDDSNATSSQGLVPLIGTFLTPLLPVGTFFFIQARSRHSRSVVLSAVILVPPSILALLSFSLNRAALLLPPLVMLLVLLRLRPQGRIGLRILSALAVGALIFVSVGQLRNDLLLKQQGIHPVAHDTWTYSLNSLEVYAQSPYLSGILYEQVPSGEFTSQSLLSSALAPIPLLGQHFREETGSRIYNFAIYRGVANDQILPIWAEVDISLGPIGLLLFGIAIGMYLRRLHISTVREGSGLVFYVKSFWSLWVAQIPIISVSVLSQLLLYFVLPLVLFVGGISRATREEMTLPTSRR